MKRKGGKVIREGCRLTLESSTGLNLTILRRVPPLFPALALALPLTQTYHNRRPVTAPSN